MYIRIFKIIFMTEYAKESFSMRIIWNAVWHQNLKGLIAAIITVPSTFY
jgi:hypothetical protein